MEHADFVHLHNHSDYSLLDGASPIPAMVERAAALRMPALALTDHGALFGAVEFYEAARKAGVKPIVGMEAYVTRGSRKDRGRENLHHLVLLARDEAGFKNLMRLSSLAFLEGFYYKPRVDHDALAHYAQGLVALSACLKGEVASDLLEGNEEGAYRSAMLHREIFGPESYFLEIQNHGTPREDRARERIVALSRRSGIPLVATNDCHYLRHEDAGAHDVLLCIGTGKTVDEQDRLRYESDQVYLKSAAEMKLAFPDHADALRNTLAVAERCNLQMSFGTPLLPAFPLPAGAGSPEEFLRGLAHQAVAERYPSPGEEVRKRLEYELDVICRMGFASYFLIVRDFIDFAHRSGIGVGPGRGSVAGSLVAYVLRITDIDPLEHGLIFERFLNPERVTMPDIDIDFDDLRRGEVIDYVKSKYGQENVTQIITFGTLGAKGVVRDVGRALGMAYAEVDRIAKLVPDGLGMTLERALELSPDLRGLPQRGPQFARLLEAARTLEGLTRHASTHAAGVLITPGPLMDYVPLYRQNKGEITTQWDMKSVEKAGLLKMDFLGLRTLSVLAEAARLVKERHAVELDLPKLPMDDEPAYRVFQEAETVAIFQFESPGMRDYLKKLKPTVFGDLVAMNALYRPGPMENIPYFIDCKHGRQVVRYEHPDLEPILKGTYGVFVYQEQVMEAAHVLAGFSMAEADELRRAMGKKRREEMEAKRLAFVEGCKRRKIPAAKAEKIFQTMEKFAGYGFNRCVVGETELVHARTGERTTVDVLFRARRPFAVHALGEDWTLRPRQILDVVWNGRQPVFELRTEQGMRITATANHPFRTLEGWRRLDELRPGDRVAAPRALEVASQVRWPRHELIALAGLLSEGNTCHPTTLYFYGNDRVLIDDFAAAISCFPDTVARIARRMDRRNLSVSANLGRAGLVRDGGPWLEESAFQGNLALVLDAPGRRSGAFRWAERLGLIGCKATEKRIPDEVFSLRDEDLELFLGRLWAGDGFVANDRNPRPFYATSSPALARGVQTLLLRLGIVSGVHAKRFKYRGGVRPGYTVNLVGPTAVEAFLRRVCPHALGRERQVEVLRRHVAGTARDLTSKDTVPAGVRSWVDAVRKRHGLTWVELERRSGVSMREFCGRGSARKQGFHRSTLARLARCLGSLPLSRIAESDVFWDRVVSVKPRGIQDTYDLTVEHDHNFVANGLVVHNSHSAAYALLAYQSAYLKAHYPAEFMTATLTSEMSDSDRIVTLVEECRRLGLEVRPPDVNRSEWKFTLEDGAVRWGLGAVRNVGQGAAESLVGARQAGGPYRDLFDLVNRIDSRAANRRVLESLVAAGACDALGDRACLFAAAPLYLERAAGMQRERLAGQESLFGSEAVATLVSPPLPEVPAWSRSERSAREREVLGFYFSEHPLEPLRDALARVATHTLGEVVALGDGAEARVAGLVAEVKSVQDRKGRRMAFITLEDLTGRAECLAFADLYEQAASILQVDRVICAGGRVSTREERSSSLVLNEVLTLEEALEAYRRALHLEVRAEGLSDERLEQIEQVLSQFPGNCEVYVHFVLPDHSTRAYRSRRFRVAEDERVLALLEERLPGARARWGRRP